jgi:PadR family transcriptional regulator AphA
MRRGTTPFAILGMLSLGPMSGYDLRKTVQESIAHFWNESYGQIYPALRRLSREGYAELAPARDGARRDRKQYGLTRKGRRELRRWLAEPVRYEKPRSEILLKLFFGRHVPLSVSARNVKQFGEYHRQLLQLYRHVATQLKQRHAQGKDLRFWLMTLSFGRHRSQAFVRWSDETLRALRLLEKSAANHSGSVGWLPAKRTKHATRRRSGAA